MRKTRLWIISELYYPEEVSTGHLLTKLAEQLAATFEVRVLCSQPTYQSRGISAPRRESRNGVDIIRCRGTRFDKNHTFGRLTNLITITISLFFNAALRICRGDVVIVVTNPPLLPFSISAACCIKHASCVLLCHDVYPDVLVHAGLLRSEGVLVRAAHHTYSALLKRFDAIVVIGRDMRTLIESRLQSHDNPVVLIPNWGDVDTIYPIARNETRMVNHLGLERKFVVQFSGNMGRTHDVILLVEAAEIVRHREDIHFLLIGAGAQKNVLLREVCERGLTNVTVHDYAERSGLNDSLNACDVAVVTLKAGMAGVSVPSRTYNILAAGKPIIAVTDPQSELAQVVMEEDVGWVVPPGNSCALAHAIVAAEQNRDCVARKGQHARGVAEQKYTLPKIAQAYELLIQRVTAK